MGCYLGSMVFANSPFRKILDERLLRVFEAGLTKIWFEKELNKSILYQDYVEEVKPLTLRHFLSPSYSFILGNIISILTFMGELISFKYYRK